MMSLVMQALAAEDERLKQVEAMMSVDERRRSYNVRYDDKALTDEQIDAYQRRRVRDEDPMAHLLNKWHPTFVNSFTDKSGLHVTTFHEPHIWQLYMQNSYVSRV